MCVSAPSSPHSWTLRAESGNQCTEAAPTMPKAKMARESEELIQPMPFLEQEPRLSKRFHFRL